MELKNKELTFISGGSSGADTGIVLAGNDSNIPVNGYIKMKNNGMGQYKSESGIELKYTSFYPASSHPDKDKLNVDLCDILIAFRLNRPMTGRGTDQTINYATCGKYEFNDGKSRHVPLLIGAEMSERLATPNPVNEIKYKDEFKDKIQIIQGTKPVFLIWNLSNDNLKSFTSQLKELVKHYRNKSFMVSGPTEETYQCEKLVRDLIVGTFS